MIWKQKVLESAHVCIQTQPDQTAGDAIRTLGAETHGRELEERNGWGTRRGEANDPRIGRRTGGAEAEDRGRFRKEKNLRKRKRKGDGIEVEMRVDLEIDIRLHLRTQDADRGGAVGSHLCIGGMGGGAQRAVRLTGIRTLPGSTAGGSVIRSCRTSVLLHGAVGRAGMSVQALPGSSGNRGHQHEGQTQEPGKTSSIVKGAPLHVRIYIGLFWERFLSAQNPGENARVAVR